MKINHPALIDSLKKAYSAEKSAAFAYIGHANSLKDPNEKAAVQQIEQDEWEHRKQALAIMQQYEIPVSKHYEFKNHFIGRLIGLSCHFIGRFMPYFFADKVESGNVCEYFLMKKYFHKLGITEHDKSLYEMVIKEKEHEVHLLNIINDSKWIPYFERVFNWGKIKAIMM